MDTEALITSHEHWLRSRAAKLSTFYRADFDDCLSTLTVYLLEYRSRKTAFLRALRDIKKEVDQSCIEHGGNYEEVTTKDTGPASAEIDDFLDSHLDDFEALVVRLHLAGLTQQEIADRVGEWQPTICGILNGALEILREEWPDAT